MKTIKMETKTARTVENPDIGDRATFVETAEETNGTRTLIHIELVPKGGNALHIHTAFDETFTAMEGVLGVQLEDQILYLHPGARATVKIGQKHRFFNPSDTETIQFSVLLEPGSSNFEMAIQVVYGLSRDGLTRNGIPKNLYHLALVGVWSDTHLPGIEGGLGPVFRWLAARAVRKGIDRELKYRYCKF